MKKQQQQGTKTWSTAFASRIPIQPQTGKS